MNLFALEKRKRAAALILSTLKLRIGKSYQTMIQALSIRYKNDPFVILIACMLSARARDDTVLPIVINLFDVYKKPYDFLCEDPAVVEEKIKSIGFYRQKTRYIYQICSRLQRKYDGLIPQSRDKLIELPGVGAKTSALVLSEAFNIPAICVDTHVMRLAYEFGLTNKEKPCDIERDLQEIFEPCDWRDINHYFVIYGQRMCFVWSQKCHKCVDKSLCMFLRSLVK